MEAVLNKTDFDFYIKFSKPLILNLPDAKDRVLAASWVRKLKEEKSGSENLRCQYLKLLLFVLQRRTLAGVFSENPSKYEVLEEFPEEYNLSTIAKELMEKEQAQRNEKNMKRLKGELGSFPEFSTDYSADFKEYVAAQDIPHFGVHVYYAIGKHTLPHWENSDKGRFPKVAKSSMDTNNPPSIAMTLSSPLFSTSVTEEKKVEETTGQTEGGGEGEGGAEEKPPDAEKKVEIIEPKKSPKRTARSLGASPPITPLGKVIEKETERSPPTWGSNLLEVKENAEDAEAEEEPEEVPEELPSRRASPGRISPKAESTRISSSPRRAPEGMGSTIHAPLSPRRDRHHDEAGGGATTDEGISDVEGRSDDQEPEAGDEVEDLQKRIDKMLAEFEKEQSFSAPEKPPEEKKKSSEFKSSAYARLSKIQKPSTVQIEKKTSVTQTTVKPDSKLSPAEKTRLKKTTSSKTQTSKSTLQESPAGRGAGRGASPGTLSRRQASTPSPPRSGGKKSNVYISPGGREYDLDELADLGIDIEDLELMGKLEEDEVVDIDEEEDIEVEGDEDDYLASDAEMDAFQEEYDRKLQAMLDEELADIAEIDQATVQREKNLAETKAYQEALNEQLSRLESEKAALEVLDIEGSDIEGLDIEALDLEGKKDPALELLLKKAEALGGVQPAAEEDDLPAPFDTETYLPESKPENLISQLVKDTENLLNFVSGSPAMAGHPLTTPMHSPSPRRVAPTTESVLEMAQRQYDQLLDSLDEPPTVLVAQATAPTAATGAIPKRTGIPTTSGIARRGSGIPAPGRASGIPRAGGAASGIPRAGGAASGIPRAGASRTGIPRAGGAATGIPRAGTPATGIPRAGTPATGIPRTGTPATGIPRAGAAAGGIPQATSSRTGIPRTGASRGAAAAGGIPQATSSRTGIPRTGAAAAGGRPRTAPAASAQALTDETGRLIRPRKASRVGSLTRTTAEERPPAGTQVAGKRSTGAIPKTRRPSGIQPPKTGRPSGIQPPKAGRPSGIQPPKAGRPSGIQPPKAGRPSGIQPPRAGRAAGPAGRGSGIPGARGARPSGIAKPSTSRTGIPRAGAAQTGIPRAGASRTGIPVPGGAPRTGIPRPGAGRSGIPGAGRYGASRIGRGRPAGETPYRRRPPVEIISPPSPSTTPEVQDLAAEYEKERDIWDRIMGIWRELEPDYPEDLPMTPPPFSRHPEIREAAEGLRYRLDQFQIPEKVPWKGGARYLKRKTKPSPGIEERGMQWLLDQAEAKVKKQRDKEEKLARIVTPERRPPPFAPRRLFATDDSFVEGEPGTPQRSPQLEQQLSPAEPLPEDWRLPTWGKDLRRIDEVQEAANVLYEEEGGGLEEYVPPGYESPPPMSPETAAELDAKYEAIWATTPGRRPGEVRPRTPFYSTPPPEFDFEGTPPDPHGLPPISNAERLFQEQRQKEQAEKEATAFQQAVDDAMNMIQEQKQMGLVSDEGADDAVNALEKAERQYNQLLEETVAGEEAAGAPCTPRPKRRDVAPFGKTFDGRAISPPAIYVQPPTPESPPPWQYETPPRQEPLPERRRLPSDFTPPGLYSEDVPWGDTPPTPPSPFEYEGTPEFDFEEGFHEEGIEAGSPPLRDILETHQYPPGWYDYRRQFAKVPVMKQAAPGSPTMSPAQEWHEDVLEIQAGQPPEFLYEPMGDYQTPPRRTMAPAPSPRRATPSPRRGTPSPGRRPPSPAAQAGPAPPEEEQEERRARMLQDIGTPEMPPRSPLVQPVSPTDQWPELRSPQAQAEAAAESPCGVCTPPRPSPERERRCQVCGTFLPRPGVPCHVCGSPPPQAAPATPPRRRPSPPQVPDLFDMPALDEMGGETPPRFLDETPPSPPDSPLVLECVPCGVGPDGSPITLRTLRTQPDLFDMPALDELGYESPPDEFDVSPTSDDGAAGGYSPAPVSPGSPGSPPIDLERLKAEIGEAEEPSFMSPYRKRVGKQRRLVKRRSAAPTVETIREPTEMEEWMEQVKTAEDRRGIQRRPMFLGNVHLMPERTAVMPMLGPIEERPREESRLGKTVARRTHKRTSRRRLNFDRMAPPAAPMEEDFAPLDYDTPPPRTYFEGKRERLEKRLERMDLPPLPPPPDDLMGEEPAYYQGEAAGGMSILDRPIPSAIPPPAVQPQYHVPGFRSPTPPPRPAPIPARPYQYHAPAVTGMVGLESPPRFYSPQVSPVLGIEPELGFGEESPPPQMFTPTPPRPGAPCGVGPTAPAASSFVTPQPSTSRYAQSYRTPPRAPAEPRPREIIEESEEYVEEFPTPPQEFDYYTTGEDAQQAQQLYTAAMSAAQGQLYDLMAENVGPPLRHLQVKAPKPRTPLGRRRPASPYIRRRLTPPEATQTQVSFEENYAVYERPPDEIYGSSPGIPGFTEDIPEGMEDFKWMD